MFYVKIINKDNSEYTTYCDAYHKRRRNEGWTVNCYRYNGFAEATEECFYINRVDDDALYEALYITNLEGKTLDRIITSG